MLRSLFLFAVPAMVAFGQKKDADLGLADLSVEELLNAPVTSLSRKAQRVAKAPAAVYVITQEDLRRSGVTNIPEALRMVPGMYVAQFGGGWAVGARGGTSRFNDKMLVMIDGRSVYNNLFGGVYWEHLDLLLEDVDRIEVIRGTGGLMWGADAFNGVINIITQTAKQTVGNLVSLTAGTAGDHGVIGVRHGGKLRNGAYRVWGKFMHRDLISEDSPVYRWMYSAGGGSGFANIGKFGDSELGTMRSGFRVDWERQEKDQFTIQGDVFGGSGETLWAFMQPTSPFGVVAMIPDTPAGGNVMGNWVRTGADGVETSVRTYFDHLQYRAPVVSQLDVVDADLMQTRPMGEGHELVWGVNFRNSRTHVGVDNFQFQTQSPERSDALFGAVVREVIEIRPNRWYVSAGVRVEHNNYTGVEYQPSVRALYTPNKRNSMWASWSRGVRTPSRTDQDLTFNGFVGMFGTIPLIYRAKANPAFEAERVYAQEGGYRYQGKRWSVDTSVFYNRYGGIRSYAGQTPELQYTPFVHYLLPMLAINGREETKYGGEFWGTWNPFPKLRIQPSYSLVEKRSWEMQSVDSAIRTLITGEEPAHQFRLRSLLDLTGTWQFDTAFYRVSAIPMSNIAAGTRLDLRVNWRPTRKQEWSFGIYDAVQHDSLEGAPLGPYLSTPPRRGLLMKWVYKF